MGGRETGSMATLLPGHRDPHSAADRAELARLWGVESLPSAAGLPALELFEAAAAGRIQALWIACTNPAYSLPDQALVRKALAKVPFVVVQEAYATETTALADLLLPAATFGERSGTMTSSERRVSLSLPAVPPPGEARPDWAIAAQFARALATRIAPAKAALFDWPDAAAVFAEYAALTAGRDLDIAGLDHARLAHGPVQWPLRAAAGVNADAHAQPDAGAGTARLYTDGHYATPDGRARFVQIQLRGAAETVDGDFPLALTSARLRDQWHCGSRSATATTLAMPPAMLQLAPASLAAAGLAEGELAVVASAQGQLALPVLASDTLPEGVAALAMHHGARWLPGSLGINALSTRARDPLSRQPELKFVPVRVTPLALPWHAALLARVPVARVLPLLEVLAREIEPLRYAALARFPAGEDAGVLLFAAHAERPDRLMQELRLLLGIEHGAPALAEARSGRQRCLQIRDGRLHAVVLEGVRRADLAAWPLYQRLVASGDDCSARPLRELFAPELGGQPA
jgi:assimilatory nitrate reductase catalytic subunit